MGCRCRCRCTCRCRCCCRARTSYDRCAQCGPVAFNGHDLVSWVAVPAHPIVSQRDPAHWFLAVGVPRGRVPGGRGCDAWDVTGTRSRYRGCRYRFPVVSPPVAVTGPTPRGGPVLRVGGVGERCGCGWVWVWVWVWGCGCSGSGVVTCCGCCFRWKAREILVGVPVVGVWLSSWLSSGALVGVGLPSSGLRKEEKSRKKEKNRKSKRSVPQVAFLEKGGGIGV